MVGFILKIVDVLTQFNSNAESVNQSYSTLSSLGIPTTENPSNHIVDEEGAVQEINLIDNLEGSGNETFTAPSEEGIIDIFLLTQNTTVIEVFKLLNYSLISGEYIGNPKIKEDIEKVIEKISLIFNITNDFDIRLQTIILELNSVLSIGIDIYNIFIRDMKINILKIE